MSIYIISNRKVVNGHFLDKGKEHAMPIFRIARCEIDQANKTTKYKLIKDDYPADYSSVINTLNDKKNNGDKLLGSASMFYDLYNQMLESKDERSDVLFFIHGFANSFTSNLKHIYELNKIFIKNGSPIKHIVYFAWPTRNHKFFTYSDDQKDADASGKLLARIYEKLLDFFIELFKIHQKEHCNNKIHLAAHSMGNQVLASMLDSITGKTIPLFSEVLLLHSDVENTVFDPGQPFTKLAELSERTHIYIHKSDDALRISRFTKNFNKRLGQRGPRDRSILNNETFIVDVSADTRPQSLREGLIDHWGYLERDIEKKDIIEVLKGSDEDKILWREKIGNNSFIIKEQ